MASKSRFETCSDRSSGELGRRFIGVIALAGLFVLGGCVGGDVPDVPPDDEGLVLGQLIYSSNCASCHGNTGGGGVGTRLNRGRVVENFPDAADQRALIVDGKDRMPSFLVKLSDEELDAVVRYTREIISEQ